MEEGLLYTKLTGKKAKAMSLLQGGYSNRTFLINGTDVLRVKGGSDPFFYKAKEEGRILKALSRETAPRPLSFDENTGDMVSEYLEGSKEFLGPETDEKNLLKAEDAIRKLHETKGDFVPFDLWGRMKKYQSLSGEAMMMDVPHLQERINSMFAGERMVLCHNDLVRGNVLLKKDGKVALIDFEFAGMNYPEFDLASLYSENGLPPELLKKHLEKTDEKTRLLIRAANRLWYYWALCRYKETGRTDFRLIAESKLAAIKAEHH